MQSLLWLCLGEKTTKSLECLAFRREAIVNRRRSERRVKLACTMSNDKEEDLKVNN